MAHLYIWANEEVGTRRLFQIGSAVADSQQESKDMLERLGADLAGAFVTQANGAAHLTHLNLNGVLPSMEQVQQLDREKLVDKSSELTRQASAMPIQSVKVGRCHILVVLINGGCLKFSSPFDLDCRYVKPGDEL